MQANTKFKNSMGLCMGGVFSLSQCCFLLKASLNFSPEKKNIKDSSGAFVGQGNGY